VTGKDEEKGAAGTIAFLGGRGGKMVGVATILLIGGEVTMKQTSPQLNSSLGRKVELVCEKREPQG